MTDKTYQIDRNIIWKDVDGVVYILQPEQEEIHALNETGTLIWKLIDKGYTLKQVQKKFLVLYKVTDQQAKNDIQAFIDRYVREKFLKPLEKHVKK
jgi:outer membrane protein assembly factor BamB